jgi:tetratricopeptide (TPR) repeat protein
MPPSFRAAVLSWKALVVVGTSVALVSGVALGLGATGRWRGPAAAAPPAAKAPALASGLTAPSAASQAGPANAEDLAGIAKLQRRLGSVPEDWSSWAQLGLAYVQQARATADPTWYPKADAALRRSLSLRAEDNFEAMTGMGALAAGRHDFAGALRWGERARAANPWNSSVYGVIGDALVELGRYPEGFRALQRMVDLRPDLSSYARASYAWELQGRTEHAIDAMRLALEAAASPADAAWASYYLGELYWNTGKLQQAEASYRQGTLHDPSFVPNREGLAKVAAAGGRTREAVAGYQWAIARYPLPQYVIELGDLYAADGQRELARQQYDLLRAEERLFAANGVNVDLELALFDADHRTSPDAGVRAARAEWSRRHSVNVADALAWALHAAGNDREALRYSRFALRLGTRSALFHFHKGMIERSLGQLAAARADLATALEINPHFSPLWAPVAAKALAATGASG